MIAQQQALRIFHAAHAAWLASLRRGRKRYATTPPEQRPAPPSPPSWREGDANEGFRIVAVRPQEGRRLNRGRGQVLIGWVRFRSSCPVAAAKSYRITRDRGGPWHVAFAAVPPAIPAPGNGEVVGVDRGVRLSAALSTRELLKAPWLRPAERRRLRLPQRRRARARLTVARLKAREADRRRDWTEKVITDLARRFDLVCVEDLDVRAMTSTASGTLKRPGRGVRQRTGLNRGILAGGWGGLVERCVACAWTGNADYDAARNIAAAGPVVAARGGQGAPGPVNREPPRLGAVA